VVDLPAFPLTGIFVKEAEPGKRDVFDQAVLMCERCGHAQLEIVLEPFVLYGEQYAHRSSASHLTSSSSDFICNYIEERFAGKKFKNVFEIGCNDLVLLRKMAKRAVHVTGVDPLWRAKQPENIPGNMKIVGDFVENVDFEVLLDEKPDLILSTHNIEHIVNPKEQFSRVFEAAADDAFFVIEVPDMDCMVANLRFDQVFHQHLHYFGFSSLLKLFTDIGAHYVNHTMNWHNWGGSLIMCFSKKQQRRTFDHVRPVTTEEFKKRYALYRQNMRSFRQMIEGMPGKKWGYGAAQMLPSLAYHLDSDLSFFEGVLDDDVRRAGYTYPTVRIRIHAPDRNLSLKDATVVITALDAVRPIMNRLRDLDPRFIATVNQVF